MRWTPFARSGTPARYVDQFKDVSGVQTRTSCRYKHSECLDRLSALPDDLAEVRRVNPHPDMDRGHIGMFFQDNIVRPIDQYGV